MTRWMTPRERFDAQVAKSDGCWQWTGTRNEAGYGQIGVEGRTMYAHRFAYEAFVGPIPDGLVVDHLCGDPSCVNPQHLEVVPQATNVRRGGLARLTPELASEIREATGTQGSIAKRYGVSQGMVSMIKNGQRWAVSA